jgi:transcriptional regulator with XRE-family HTH domain
MNSFDRLLLKRLQVALEPHGALSEFCRKTRLPRKTVENWLNGTTIPTTAVDTIAEGLGTPTWELLKPEETHPTSSSAESSRLAALGSIITRLTALDKDEIGNVALAIDAIEALRGSVKSHQLRKDQK